MAYIKAIETSQKRNGKPAKRYAVIWREPVRDNLGCRCRRTLTTPTARSGCVTVPSGTRPARPRKPAWTS